MPIFKQGPFGMFKKASLGLILPVLLLVLWDLGSRWGFLNAYIIPSPEKTFLTLNNMLWNGVLLRNIGVSLMRVFSGFLIAASLSTVLVLTCYIFTGMFILLKPTLGFVRHIPPLALISILILSFGLGETSKIFVVFLASFFPIFLNFWAAISHCDHKLLEVGQVAHMSRIKSFKKIVLPASIPSLLTGMQLGLSYGWRSLVGAELLAASSGIGYMIMDAREFARSDVIFVGIITLGCLGYVIDTIVFSLARILLRPYLYMQDKKYGTLS